MELIDILDSEGAPMGLTKPYDAVHRDGDWHRTAHVWIVTPRGDILFQKRSRDSFFFPLCWDVSSAGHISAGETSKAAAVRETAEELGLTVSISELEYLFSNREEYVFDNLIERVFHDMYFVERDVTLSDLKIQEDEIADVKLIHCLEFERRLQEHPEQFVPREEEYKRLIVTLKKRFE